MARGKSAKAPSSANKGRMNEERSRPRAEGDMERGERVAMGAARGRDQAGRLMKGSPAAKKMGAKGGRATGGGRPGVGKRSARR